MEPFSPTNRQQRQRVEILASIVAGRLDRAADLAHEHFFEFPEDESTRKQLIEALVGAESARLRHRADEFTA